jgi:hypothetical protein
VTSQAATSRSTHFADVQPLCGEAHIHLRLLDGLCFDVSGPTTPIRPVDARIHDVGAAGRGSPIDSRFELNAPTMKTRCKKDEAIPALKVPDRAGTWAVLVSVVVAGCASLQPRPTENDADVAWVCAQHDLLTDFRGRITFEDVRRTLCYVGKYGGGVDFANLEGAARAAARPCEQVATSSDVLVSPRPLTMSELYDHLSRAAATASWSPGCGEAAMIAGMVRVLGEGYAFHSVDEPPRVNVVEPPTASLINKTIVYARFPRFLTGGQASVEKALASARSDHAVTGLLLDLRGTDGEPVEALARFVDLFVDDGVVLEWGERRTGEIVQRRATRRPPAETLPLLVLVDEKTQSGAEAFAGVLRARGRALLMGRRTLGRALVQTELDLPSGSQLVIPVGDLIEPGAGVITGRGVTPDIDVGAAHPVPEVGDKDDVIRFATQVLSTTRSPARGDLLNAAQRLLAAQAAPK